MNSYTIAVAVRYTDYYEVEANSFKHALETHRQGKSSLVDTEFHSIDKNVFSMGVINIVDNQTFEEISDEELSKLAG
jgi:Zn-dependent oligopeptidase